MERPIVISNGKLFQTNTITKRFEEINTDFQVFSYAVSPHHIVVLDIYGSVWVAMDFGRKQFTRFENDETFISVASGKNQIFALDQHGKIWGYEISDMQKLSRKVDMVPILKGIFGSPEYKTLEPIMLRRVRSDEVFIRISGGHSHFLALDKNGNIWSYGSNDNGQLGLGDNKDRISFVKVNLNNKRFSAIDCGSYTSLALDTNGNVWACGSLNYEAYLGFGVNNAANRFKQITAGAKLIAVKDSGSHYLALDEFGHIWSYGLNDCGQLGVNDRNDHHDRFKQVIPERVYVDIDAGQNYSLALDSNGNIWACGLNSQGQLGLGDNIGRAYFDLVRDITADGLTSTTIIRQYQPKSARNV